MEVTVFSSAALAVICPPNVVTVTNIIRRTAMILLIYTDGTAQAMLNIVVSADGFDHIEIQNYTGGKLTIGIIFCLYSQ